MEAQELKKSLMPDRIQIGEAARNVYFVTVEPHTTKEELMDPSFWAHVAPKLTPFSRLEVTTDDVQYFLELLVVNCGTKWAVVKELKYLTLNGDEDFIEFENKMAEYEIKWKGPKLKFSVIRKKDNETMKDSMGSKEEAATFLREYIKVINK